MDKLKTIERVVVVVVVVVGVGVGVGVGGRWGGVGRLFEAGGLVE